MRSVLLRTLVLIALPVLAQPGTTVPVSASERIPNDTLQKMYERELGKLYDPNQADALLSAHQQIESYFAARSVGERDAAQKALEESKINPNILGRLCRIRLDWAPFESGVYYINERYNAHPAHYFLGIPRNYDRTVPWPLVIKLPAADAFIGRPRADANQVVEIYKQWITQEMDDHPNALVIMPLLNLDTLYGPGYAGMNSVMIPLQHAFNRVNIDPARVYMLGHSMSAHAAWNLALHFTTYFSSFAALAGGASNDWQRLRLMNLCNVLPVVWHDANDTVIRPESSRKLVSTLKRLKIDYNYEETKNIGHVPTEMIARNCYERMISRVRSLYPKQVWLQSNRPDTVFNRIDWVQMYQPLRAGDDQKHVFSRGGGYMIASANTWKVQATNSGGNRFDVITDNVEVLRLYVNDQMIDFSKPVSVTVNKRGKFETLVPMSVEEMLVDQQVLGRGWRYFTGVIDLDFATAPATRPATRNAPAN